ncbi:MAG TPA: DNA adenine methylase [Phycisphaerales bacterium]|nr:DNA adenine methylase [Phycisphaerales bacterium]
MDDIKNTMKITSLLPYYGSKRTLAPTIVRLMGDHKSYWEPFCGSMAVLFAKPPCTMETMNDMYGDLINLAKVVQDPELGVRLYGKLSRTLCSEQFFDEAKERWFENEEPYVAPDIDRAYNFFVASWMGINGVSGTERCNYKFALRWCAGGGHGATRWQSVVSSIPAWHRRLQNVLIINRDAFEIIGNIKDEQGTVIYCDPPYIEKSNKYVHDFESETLFNKSGHQRLAKLLNRFKSAKVIVSYYEHRYLAGLYAGWEEIVIEKSRQSMRNATRGDKKKPAHNSREVLLLNKAANEKQ